MHHTFGDLKPPMSELDAANLRITPCGSDSDTEPSTSRCEPSLVSLAELVERTAITPKLVHDSLCVFYNWVLYYYKG